MKLEDVAAGASIFVEANILIYALAPDATYGTVCHAFLERIYHDEVKAYTSPTVLNDVAHRLMLLEACDVFGWPNAGVANRLRRHPSEISKLQRFRGAIDQIANSKLVTLVIDVEDARRAGELSIEHGLFGGDALIAAVMQRHNLTLIASHDADFDRVAHFTRFAPM
jgi:predicted nucleic acid-binding protein